MFPCFPILLGTPENRDRPGVLKNRRRCSRGTTKFRDSACIHEANRTDTRRECKHTAKLRICSATYSRAARLPPHRSRTNCILAHRCILTTPLNNKPRAAIPLNNKQLRGASAATQLRKKQPRGENAVTLLPLLLPTTSTHEARILPHHSETGNYKARMLRHRYNNINGD